ncbi:MAG: uroporphyrinogen-III C-methyltransferase, partial [Gammaproteobacteria bacterium]
DELLLRSNVGNALAALRAADTRLRDAGNALFSNVRAKLAQDILALESLPDPDITGMALTLASLANVVESLPLRKADSPHNTGEEALPDEAGAWQRFKAATKRLFSSVVTVRHDTDLRPFVTPEQEYFLLRNLELKLESTLLSLLMQDTANFQAGADVTVEWLERYFDTSDSAVAAAREQLLIMRDNELPATFPDLSGTLRLLEIAEHN